MILFKVVLTIHSNDLIVIKIQDQAKDAKFWIF